MERFLMTSLMAWKESSRRKPLLLMGARQVGKTYLLKAFGSRAFNNLVHVDFEHSPKAARIFEEDLDAKRIVTDISNMTGQRIVPGETLLVLDEIQECPRALTSLKYFCEDAPEYAVAAAGSLLGISLGRERGSSFPVGKIHRLNLYPLSFREFLDARGAASLRNIVDSGDLRSLSLFEQDFLRYLREYLVVGGMPEAVQAFLESDSFWAAREIQQSIAFDYEDDIAKHLSKPDATRALDVWRSIPRQLSKENKRFLYTNVQPKGRGKQYRDGIAWLTKAEIATKVCRVTSPEHPLAGFADQSIFKLFFVDVGLLGTLCGLEPSSVVESNEIFRRYKGALTEQYVCQQLIAESRSVPFYWSANDSTAENDFLYELAGKLFAIEVKGGEAQRSKSLGVIARKFPWVTPVRLSLKGYKDEGWMRNIPLYAMASKALWVANPQPSAEPQERILSPRERQILALIRENPRASYDDLAAKLQTSRATVARDIRRLRDEQYLRREGDTRNGRWVVLREQK